MSKEEHALLDVVTFDFWNTIMWEGPDALVSSRMRALLGVVEEGGSGIGEDALRAAHEVAFQHYQRAWHANEQFCVPDAVGVLVAELGLEDSPRLRSSLCDAFDAGGEAAELHLCDGVEECLRTLHSWGIRLSIVCDIGLTPSPVLRRRLSMLGLLGLFASWAFSDEVGFYKPAPEIFDAAFAPLGAVDRARSAHVGDRRRTDVAGAKAAGMVAVRYSGVYEDEELDPVLAPEGDVVVATYPELVAWVGERNGR